MIRPIPLAATAALLASAAVLVPSPAQAQLLEHHDQRNDVWQTHIDTDRLRPAEPGTVPDITKVVVRHGKRAVVIRMRVSDLPRANRMAGMTVTTSTQQFEYLAGRIYGAGFNDLMAADGTEIGCVGLRTEFKRGAGVIRMSIPRSCLDEPRWVRVGGFVSVIKGKRLSFDEAFASSRPGDDVRRSPRLTAQ